MKPVTRNLKRLYTLNPFEQDTIAEDAVELPDGVVYIRVIKALRVPGGWIFKFTESTLSNTLSENTYNQFIPYSEEWNEDNIIKGTKF
jgi:hypothetical protein